MTIRDILFPMLSYPTATAADSIERAVTLATGLGAHIVGETFELDIHSPVGPLRASRPYQRYIRG